MRIDQYTPYKSPGVPNTEPFFRVSGQSGQGCPCGCSDGFWMSVSDGKLGLKITFDGKKAYLGFLEQAQGR